MPLITLESISLSYGAPALLENVDLNIERGERVCVVGRNGCGKSTLLRIVDREVEPDAGVVRVPPGVTIARLHQEVPPGLDGSVFDLVAGGLGELGGLVAEYHALSHDLAVDGGDGRALARLADVQAKLEAQGGWEIEQRAERVVSRLGLDPDIAFATLSGGLKRRVMLARALVRDPDLLLLDEPTNHLDIATIDWLEELLLDFQGSLLFVTHDRRFLKRLATRIVEIDRGKLTDWPGDYDNYLRRREERLHAEAVENARFDKKLSEEEVWIRQGIKARRTRNEGRVRALKSMRSERGERRDLQGKAKIQLDTGQRSGKLVCEVEGLGYRWDTKPIVKDLSTLILRGDKIGIIGPNGAGKSTLIRLLLGQLKPDVGSVRLGTNIEVAYFDQLRAGLDLDKSVRDNVGEGSDKVQIGERSIHVLSYLKDFLFTPARANQPVAALSGGERNRLLLAKLFTRPANVLVLDEPTNDLDIETLELLEELLLDFGGTLLLVSHDRAMLDSVVTSTLVLEGGGRVGEYVGGYEDWLRQRPKPKPVAETKPKPSARPAEKSAPAPKPAKLSWKEQKELDALPGEIESLEEEQGEIQAKLADPGFFQAGQGAYSQATDRLKEVESRLELVYARWEELEERRGG